MLNTFTCCKWLAVVYHGSYYTNSEIFAYKSTELHLFTSTAMCVPALYLSKDSRQDTFSLYCLLLVVSLVH